MKKTAARNVLLLAVVIGLLWLAAISAAAEESAPPEPPLAADSVETAAEEEETHVYTVTYLDAGGAVLRREQATEGEPIHDPGLRPTREGYEFTYWYDAARGTVRFVFGTPATKDLTLAPYLTEIVVPEKPASTPGEPSAPAANPEQNEQDPAQPEGNEPPEQSGQDPEQPEGNEPPEQGGQDPAQPDGNEPPEQNEQDPEQPDGNELPEQDGQDPAQPDGNEPPPTGGNPPALDTSEVPGLEIEIIPNEQTDAPKQGEDLGEAQEGADDDGTEPQGEEEPPQDPADETLAPNEEPDGTEGEDGAPEDELPADPQAPAETLYVSASMDAGSEVRYGQVITLTAVLTGNGDQPFEAFWEYDDGTGWTRVESASGLTHSFELNEQNYAWKWRLAVKLLPGV